MGRLLVVLIVMAFSGIIYLIKAGASKVTGKDGVSFQEESRKMMEKTAMGVNWMNQQWEKAKSNIGGNSQLESGNSLKNLSAIEIIARLKSNMTQVDPAQTQANYIELAVYKMGNRQFDDAEKLIRQLPEGEAREYMLDEISQKRNL